MFSEYGKVESNRNRTVAAAEWAFTNGANVVVLPELCISGYGYSFDDVGDFAEPLDGQTIEAWQRVAAANRGIVVGGLAERDGSDVYNSAVAVGADGILDVYRKLHLFANEKAGFVDGNRGLVVFDTDFGRIGLCICYDLRFVEVLRGLSLMGVDLVCAPNAWVTGYDSLDAWSESRFIPQVENVRVQANLNQLFIACACLVDAPGEEPRRFLGNSVIVGPDGGLAVDPMPNLLHGLGIARIDLNEARSMNHPDELVKPSSDRRGDVYSLVVNGRSL